jgi:hypothetical protein
MSVATLLKLPADALSEARKKIRSARIMALAQGYPTGGQTQAVCRRHWVLPSAARFRMKGGRLRRMKIHGIKPARWILWGFVFALATGGSSLAAADEFAVSEAELRRQIVEQARRLLRQRQFAELEALAEDFRSHKTRLPSGLWKLYDLYEGLKRPGFEVSGQDWVAHFELLNEWRTAFPKSPTVRTALAAAYADYAWEARGSGYASTVTEEGWRLFRQRLKQAEQVIDDAEAESLYDPHLACVHLQVGKGSSWPARRHKQVFEQAIEREPCYPPYYFQRINWLLPRWNGAPGDSERFANEAVRLNENCEGTGLYARLAVYLYGYKPKDQWFFDAFELSWPKVRDGFDELEKHYPHSLWNLNYYCLLACHARDRQTAARLFERIGERWDGSVWGNEGVYREWKNWAENPAMNPAGQPTVVTSFPRWVPIARSVVIVFWIGVTIGLTVLYIYRKRRKPAAPPPLPPPAPPSVGSQH